MSHRKKTLLNVLPVLLIGFWSGCAIEQEFSETSHIAAAFKLSTPAAMDGKITIGEAYLKLERIEVAGSLEGKNTTQITHPIAPEDPPYRLTQADTSHARFSLTSRIYDQLELRLFPFMDDYQLVYLNTSENPPPPDQPEEGESGEDKDPNGDDGNSGGDEDDQDQGQGADPKGEETGDGGDSGDDQDDGDTTGDSEEDQGDEASGNDKDDGDDDKENEDKEDEKKEDKKKDKKKKKKKDEKKNDDDDDDDDDDDRDDDDDDDDDDDRDDDDDEDDDDDDDDDDRNDRKSGNENTQLVDLDHFFQNAKPGLVVFGLYENNGKIINIIFVVTDVEKFTVRARQDDSFSIQLAGNNSGRVTFDPAKWFQSITAQDIENGSIQPYQQQKVLFIHPEHNTSLYNALVSRIETSADLEIKAGSENF